MEAITVVQIGGPTELLVCRRLTQPGKAGSAVTVLFYNQLRLPEVDDT